MNLGARDARVLSGRISTGKHLTTNFESDDEFL